MTRRQTGTRAASFPRHSASATFEVSVATDIGRVRKNNEDYVSVRRISGADGTYQLWVVADGIGGGLRGEVASELAVNAIVEHLGTGRWTDPAQALAAAFRLANARVNEHAVDGGMPNVMGTTLVAALVVEDKRRAYVANVGDSRAYLLSQDTIQRITQDHSLAAVRVAVGMLSEAEAELAESRHILTRGIGVEARVTVDLFGPLSLQAGERLLLCTDGLHGMLSDAEIAELARTLPTSALAAALVHAANAAGGRDNITAVVGGPAAWAPSRDTPDPRGTLEGHQRRLTGGSA